MLSKKARKKSRPLTDRVYDENKKLWWERRSSHIGELHHVYGRNGVFKCCLHFFELGEVGHQNEVDWVGRLRKKYEADRIRLLSNYMKGVGCKEWIFPECSACAMVKFGEHEAW